jgi:hypothetical protein
MGGPQRDLAVAVDGAGNAFHPATRWATVPPPDKLGRNETANIILPLGSPYHDRGAGKIWFDGWRPG